MMTLSSNEELVCIYLSPKAQKVAAAKQVVYLEKKKETVFLVNNFTNI